MMVVGREKAEDELVRNQGAQRGNNCREGSRGARSSAFKESHPKRNKQAHIHNRWELRKTGGRRLWG